MIKILRTRYRRFASSLSVAVIAISITACATIGREVSEEQVAMLKQGETTPAQTVQLLGNPTSTTTTSDGRQLYTYSFAHAQVRPATFIPIVGLFAGGHDVRSSALVITFGPDGLLKEYSTHRSTTGMGTGFAAGPYANPDPTLPQAAK